MFGKVTIKKKIMLIVAASLVGLVVVVGISLSTLRSQMFSERQAQTRHLIELAGTLVDHYTQEAGTAGFPMMPRAARPWPRSPPSATPMESISSFLIRRDPCWRMAQTRNWSART